MTSVAGRLCHAAGQFTYEVREIRDGNPALDLGVRHTCSDYDEAEDFAFGFLESNDPAREGKVAGLDIVEVVDGERRTLCSYRHQDVSDRTDDLVSLWGFDVTRAWRGPGAPVR